MSSPLIVGYQQANAYTAAKDRQIQVHKMLHGAPSGGAFPARSGVILGTGLSNLDVYRNGTNLMSVDVDPGMAMVGTYSVTSPTKVVALAHAASTATARRDLIILRVYDQEAGDATGEAKIEIVKGTTTADPAVPARSLILAQADIGANATSVTITDRRVFTAAAGGVVPALSIGQISAAEVQSGGLVYDIATACTWQNAAGALRKVLDAHTLQYGQVDLAVSGGNVLFTFPQPYAAVPKLALFNGDTVAGPFTPVVSINTTGLTATSAQLWVLALQAGSGITPWAGVFRLRYLLIGQ
jgi:hypothetical protein